MKTLGKYSLSFFLSVIVFVCISLVIKPLIFASAPGNGIWIPTGNMLVGRIEHSATTLQNGKILVAGGEISFSGPLTNTTELFDPYTKTWSSTGNILLGRLTYFNSLVTLQNGKALLVGGGAVDNTPYGETELYNPSVGTWSITGSLNTPRRVALTTLLDDGRVLVAGGTASSYCGSLNTSELYNPATGSWSYTSNNLTYDRFGSSMVKMKDGRVLIAGGVVGGCGNSFYNTVEFLIPLQIPGLLQHQCHGLLLHQYL